MTTRKIATPLLLIFLALSCSESDPEPVADPTIATWDATVAGSSLSIFIKSESAQQEADGGIRLTVAGTATEGDVTFSIDFVGGLVVTFSPSDPSDPASPPTSILQAATSGLTMTLDVAGVKYRATNGTLTLSAYGIAVDDAVTGTFDIGMISASTGDPATLKASFDAVVTAL